MTAAEGDAGKKGRKRIRRKTMEREFCPTAQSKFSSRLRSLYSGGGAGRGKKKSGEEGRLLLREVNIGNIKI